MDERTGSLLRGVIVIREKKAIRKVERNRRAALRNFDFVRSGGSNTCPVHYLIRHFGNYRPNVPDQLSARKVGERRRENRRASERDGKRKGVRIGDGGRQKKSIENNRQPAMLCALYVDASDKEPISSFFGFYQENQYLHKITTGVRTRDKWIGR